MEKGQRRRGGARRLADTVFLALNAAGPVPVTCALAGLAVACSAVPRGASEADAVDRVRRVLPHGWEVGDIRTGAIPFEQVASDGSPSGRLVVLLGPRRFTVEGYYCDGSWCERPAREAIEVWVMPSGYADAGYGSMMAWRTPQLIGRGRDVRIYASASRAIPDTVSFDEGYNETSRESATWPKRDDADLAVSWTSWKDDMRRAIEGD